MKWTLTLILGWSLAETSFGWTYHHSDETLTWTEAREWCRTHYTDLVVIQNQRENDHVVSLLPNKTKAPYYWIGITKNSLNETWMWVGNNSTWIGPRSWAKGEPNNNHSNEFCVEIYVNNGPDRGKWNDEKCSNKKQPVCYKAQCDATSCVRGSCQETIDNQTCLCEPGFKGDRCQTAVECPPLSPPENGYLTCSKGSPAFTSTCRFRCRPGFLLTGPTDVTCAADGAWSSSRPDCEPVKCPPLLLPDNGNLSCSEGSHTFNTTCHFKCSPGFFMIGWSEVTCGASGSWSGPRPACASYKQALLAVAGCGAVSLFCCICFCWMKHRSRKKLAQERQPADAASPSNEANEETTARNVSSKHQ